MRKLAQLMFMALAMCFVACGEFGGHTDNGNGNGNGGSNDTPLTFKIDVSSITSSTAKVTITPSNENTYYFDIIDKETIDTYYEGNFENWAKDMVDYILNDLGETFANYVSSGKDVYLFEDLDPSTDYFAYAFGVLNDGTITTSVAYKSFKTLEGSGSGNGGSTGGELKDITFTFDVANITSSTADVTVTASTNDTFYFDVVDKASLDTYYGGDASLYAQDLVDYVVNDLGETFTDYVSMGTDSYTFEDLEASTQYYVFAFGVLANGTITSKTSTTTFTTLAGSGSDSGSGSTGGDKNLTNFAYGYYTNYGDYYEVGATNWYIDLYTADTDDMFVLEVQTATSATTFTGTYQFATTYAAGTAVAFTENGGSYWGLLDENWENIIDYAPVVSGTAVIGKSGNNYTITVDALDDNGNSIKVAYTGELEEYVDDDNTVSTQRLSNSLNNRFSTVSRLIQQKRVKVVSQSAAKAVSTKHNLSKMVLGKIRK